WEMSRRAMSVRLKQEPDGLVVELANAPQGVTLLLSGLPEALKAEPGVHLNEMPFLGRTLLRLTFDHHPPQRLTLGFAGVEVE
ncbi:MAG TPA: hypothetical protein VF171_00265, partial [Trueperaceae bacterium]